MSSKGLFIGENPEVFSIFATIARMSLGCDLIEAINFIQAQEILLEDKEYSFLIIALPIQNCPDFLKFLKENDLQIPVLFTADENTLNQVHGLLPLHPLCSRICYTMNERVLTNSLKRIVKVKERNIKKQEGYCPLPISFFGNMIKASYDIYLKLSETKYICLFRKGMPFDMQRIHAYEQKDVHYLYLKSSDYLTSSAEIFDKISTKVKPKNLPTDKLTSIAKLAHSTVITAINQLGIKNEVLKIADVGIQNLKESSRRLDTSLADHIKKVLKGKDYFSEHPLLAIFIATAIAKEVEWESDMTLNKITYSIFFHDIATNDLELAMLEDPKSLPGLSEKRLQKYLDHPRASAAMLDKINNLPPDIAKIIELQHEKPDGTGFPRGIDWKLIFPLAAVINISLELSRFMFGSGEMSEVFIEELIDEFEERYYKGHFKTAIDGARKAFALGKNQIGNE